MQSFGIDRSGRFSEVFHTGDRGCAKPDPDHRDNACIGTGNRYASVIQVSNICNEDLTLPAADHTFRVRTVLMFGYSERMVIRS